MAFETKDAAQYRAMSNEELELRRADVAAELENPDSTFSAEDMRAEVDHIKVETERREAAAELRIQTRKAVEGGSGKVLDTTGNVAGRKPDIKFVDRTAEALSSDEYVREWAHYMTTRGAKLSPEFEQYQRRDSGSAAAQATPTAGVLDDAGILVPVTIQQRIIKHLQDRGQIYNAVTHTNQRGGIKIPFGDFSMQASWIGEKETSDTQLIDPVTDYITFTYHELEVRHANTLLAEVISPNVYMENYAEAASNAFLDAIETAVLNGAGSASPLGIFKDARVTNTQGIEAADFTVKGYMEKVRNKIARLASGYRTGTLYMAETTWNYYFDGMVDETGQPVARVNYGINGETTRTIFGQHVTVLPEKYIPYLDDAEDGECFMLYGNLKDYVLNWNMQLRSDRWEDKDHNLYKSRLIGIVDGKVVNPYGFIKFTNGESGESGETGEGGLSA